MFVCSFQHLLRLFFLCEGGYNYKEGIKNNFYPYERDGKIEESGEVTRFWTTFEDHIKLASSLGLNVFRMGCDWFRVIPTTATEPHPQPEWDYDAVDNYAKIIETLIKYKLEPVITLHHFCNPKWLVSIIGSKTILTCGSIMR